MQKVITFLQKAYNTEGLRKRLWFTAAIFFVFRLLAHIPVPAVNLTQLNALFAGNDFLSLLNVFSGGTLANFSVAAVGINPYITASIIMQLGAMVFPQLKEMQKDGEAGKEKVNQYTRLLTVPLAIVQSISVLALLRSQQLLEASDPVTIVTMILTLVAGALIVMWLGELVSLYGIGNGISMVLFAGIVSQLPVLASQLSFSVTGDNSLVLITFAAVFLAVIGLIVYVNEAVRKVDIHYAKRVRGNKTYGGQTSHLPIKVNVTGVLPIIFAVTFLLVPSFLARILTATSNPMFIEWGQNLTIWFQPTSALYIAMYFAVVFLFTYFSSMVFFNAEDISNELKKSGAFVPGIRPGTATKKFLEFVVNRVTFIGATFLGFIAIMPSIAQIFTGVQSLAIGGTSILIVVSVILDTAKQAEGMMIEQNYEQFL